MNIPCPTCSGKTIDKVYFMENVDFRYDDEKKLLIIKTYCEKCKLSRTIEIPMTIADD